MQILWKDNLVAIFNPKGDGKGYWGTGVPVSNNLVITARHVLFPKKYSDDPFQICWWGIEPEAPNKRKFEKVQRTQIVWEDVALDVALFRCSLPEGKFRPLEFDYRRPADGMTWASHGFAAVSTVADQRSATSFGGSIHSAPSADIRFVLNEESPPKEEDDWGGASGMPAVSLQDTNVIGIIGICVQVPSGFKAKRIEATPVWKLFENDGFKNIIQSDQNHSERKRLLRAEIIRTISPKPSWLQDFANRLDESASLACQQSAESFIDYLLVSSVPAEEVLNTLHSLHRNREPDSESIRCFTTALAPLLVGFIRCQNGTPGDSNFDGRVGLHTMAEVAASYLDGRSCDFMPRQNDRSYAIGTKMIPIAPVAGASEHAHLQFAHSLLSDLDQRYSPVSLKDAVYAPLWEAAFESSEHSVSKGNLEADLVRIGRRLERIFAANKYRYYLAIPTRELKEPQLAFLRQSISEIRSVLPSLLIFEIDLELEGLDEDALANFPFMLPIKGENE